MCSLNRNCTNSSDYKTNISKTPKQIWVISWYFHKIIKVILIGTPINTSQLFSLFLFSPHSQIHRWIIEWKVRVGVESGVRKQISEEQNILVYAPSQPQNIRSFTFEEKQHWTEAQHYCHSFDYWCSKHCSLFKGQSFICWSMAVGDAADDWVCHSPPPTTTVHQHSHWVKYGHPLMV